MPFHRERYPADWPQISREVREAAGQECEFCGASNGVPHPITGSLVVLTVAHLDHNPMNCDRDNLRALCQKCHLSYDREEHTKNASRTRSLKKGNRDLFEGK